MAATGVLAQPEAFSGLRAVHLRRDLAAMADLIELCFASTLDTAGRSAIHEMRALSRMGPLLWLLARLSRGIPGLYGFVWVERGRLVGNVTVTPAGYGNGWMIANVAVLPDYRRRGIARQLMHAALAFVEERGAFAVLQVDADNDSARDLYAGLGFELQRTFTRWRRPAYQRPPLLPATTPDVRPLLRSQADQLYALAESVRPAARGGLGWLRPLTPTALRPARWAALRFMISGQRAQTWVVPGENGQLEAALRVEQRIGGLTRVFDVLVAPRRAGELESPLVNFALRRLIRREHSAMTEHPTDDLAASAALRDHSFRPERVLAHMIRPGPGAGNEPRLGMLRGESER
jgi:ribosomal protein S18 acetylase RimI-like enzyme